MTKELTKVPLFRQKFFLISNICIIAFSILLAMPIFISRRYEMSFSPDSYNTFLNIFKLPLTVIAMIVPFNAFYISYIRSEQSRKQIQLLSSTNNFSNYYKHIEEFEKHLKRNFDEDDIKSLNYLHKIFFPNSFNGDFTISQEVLKVIENIINTHITVIKNHIDNNNMIKKIDFRNRIVRHLFSLIELLDCNKPIFLDNHMSFINRKLKVLNDSTSATIFIYATEYYNQIYKCYSLIDVILNFDNSRKYRSLRQYLELERNFYYSFDGKNFNNSDELFEGQINIDGLLISQQFKY